VFVGFLGFFCFLLVVHFLCAFVFVWVCGLLFLGERFYEGVISIFGSGMCLGR
jgi:hypothetical protein